MSTFKPSYLHLHEVGELQRRAIALNSRMAACDLCPRQCGVNRIQGKLGYCRSGRVCEIASHCPHHGEEPALSGSRGSGTIFFAHCNLKCEFCQNYQISQGKGPFNAVDGAGLADIMLELQNRFACHNINLVSPTHYVPQIVDAINQAVPLGLRLPVVYNTNAYDSPATLQMLDGIIDIYLPDMKYASNKHAREFSHGAGYVQHCRLAIKEMHRQVGNLVTDEDGIARRGLIVRHLILPNGIAGSLSSLKWLARNVSKEVTVSILAQYNPCHMASGYPPLARRIIPEEYAEVSEVLEQIGIEHGWLQEMDSAEVYLPDFHRKDHPFATG
jgi:putative pyruvate formate lyase activating enzyme